jgi:hypothetical protein
VSDDDVFLDEMVELGGQHALQEIDAIGEDDAESLWRSDGRIGCGDLLDGEELDDVRLGEEVVVVAGDVQTRAKSSRELRHVVTLRHTPRLWQNVGK